MKYVIKQTCTYTMLIIYRCDKVVQIFELHKNGHSNKNVKPTEMVKLVFNFLKAQETQFHNENILETMKYVYLRMSSYLIFAYIKLK